MLGSGTTRDVIEGLNRYKQTAIEFWGGDLREGFDLQRFLERTGLPLSAIEPVLADGVRRGLIERDGAHVAPTVRGFDFLSDLQALFLPG